MKEIIAYAALVINGKDASPREKVTIKFNDDQTEFRIAPPLVLVVNRTGTGVVCFFAAETGPELLLKLGTEVVVVSGQSVEVT